jgi:hypothetical protein
LAIINSSFVEITKTFTSDLADEITLAFFLFLVLLSITPKLTRDLQTFSLT